MRDTNNNAGDFYFLDTNGMSAGGGRRLGAHDVRFLFGLQQTGSFKFYVNVEALP